MFAIAAHADEREAHVRELERSGRSLPEGSCGRRNRQAIAVVSGAAVITVRRPHGAAWTADLSRALIGDPDRLDLAVLDVPEAEDLASVPVALVNWEVTGGELIERCWAVGYPAFQEVKRDDAGRWLKDTAQVNGEIAPLSGLNERLLSLHVTASPKPLPAAGKLDASEWSGMSGAAVFAGDLLLGVVTEHSTQRGPSDITVTPLARLADPEQTLTDAAEWWSRLGVDNPDNLRPLPDVPSRPDPHYRAMLRVIRQRTPVLLGRDAELARIAAFAAGSGDAFGPSGESSGYVWVTGKAWAGKTALLAEAVHDAPDQVDVVAYFLLARDTDASREGFLNAVVPQLTRLLDQDDPPTHDLALFRDLWARAAARAETVGRQLLLVVDGLDEDMRPGGSSVAAALPTEQLGRHARVLVASRSSPGLPADVDPSHPLRSIEPVQLTESPSAVELRLLAEEEITRLLPRDPEVASDLAFEILGLLTAAAGPLSVVDLAMMMPGTKARVIRAFVNDRAARSLEPVGPHDRPRYRFAHQTLLDFCRGHPDVGGDRQYWERLNVWAEVWRTRRWPASDEASTDTPLYLLDSFPAVLASGGGDRASAHRLVGLVSDVAWLDSAVSRIGVGQVLAALRTASQLAPADIDLESMLRLLQLQAHHLNPVHPADRPGQTAVQLAWEAIQTGLPDVARAASDRLRWCPPPQLIPGWTTELTSHNLIRIVRSHDDGIWAMAVTGQGEVVSGGEDRTVRLWDPRVADDRASWAAMTIGSWQWRSPGRAKSSPPTSAGCCGSGTLRSPAIPAASWAATIARYGQWQ